MPVDPGQPPLSFEAFVEEVLGWVRWWNTEHTIAELGDRTPMQSWEADPTPIHDADETRLWMFTLEDDRRHRKITSKGVAFGRGRHYVADWMVGMVGTGVRIRYMPHHTGEIEVLDAATGGASGRRGARRCRRSGDPRAGAAGPRPPGAPVAVGSGARPNGPAGSAMPPRRCRRRAQRLDAITTAEAAAVLAEERDADMARWARPDLIRVGGPPPANWRRPVDLDVTEHG